MGKGKLTERQYDALKEGRYASIYAPAAGAYRRRGELGNRGCFPGPTIRSLKAKGFLAEVLPGAFRTTPAGRLALAEHGGGDG